MNYFSNLEFYPDQIEMGPSLQSKRKIWTFSVYVLLSLGIFARQMISFTPVDLNLANFRLGVFVASLIIGLAILPPVARKISKRMRKPSFMHILSAFGIGFFVDLSSFTLSKIIPSLLK